MFRESSARRTVRLALLLFAFAAARLPPAAAAGDPEEARCRAGADRQRHEPVRRAGWCDPFQGGPGPDPPRDQRRRRPAVEVEDQLPAPEARADRGARDGELT